MAACQLIAGRRRLARRTYFMVDCAVNNVQEPAAQLSKTMSAPAWQCAVLPRQRNVQEARYTVTVTTVAKVRYLNMT